MTPSFKNITYTSEDVTNKIKNSTEAPKNSTNALANMVDTLKNIHANHDDMNATLIEIPHVSQKMKAVPQNVNDTLENIKDTQVNISNTSTKTKNTPQNKTDKYENLRDNPVNNLHTSTEIERIHSNVTETLPNVQKDQKVYTNCYKFDIQAVPETQDKGRESVKHQETSNHIIGINSDSVNESVLKSSSKLIPFSTEPPIPDLRTDLILKINTLNIPDAYSFITHFHLLGNSFSRINFYQKKDKILFMMNRKGIKKKIKKRRGWKMEQYFDELINSKP